MESQTLSDTEGEVKGKCFALKVVHPCAQGVGDEPHFAWNVGCS